MPLNSSQRSF